MTTLIIATRNRHKAEEINAILGAEFRCLSLNEFPGAPPLIEDTDTFAGNAAAKATQLADWLSARGRLPVSTDAAVFVLADDSGLEVDALAGAPGVHSARFAALDTGGPGNSTDADNNAKLLRLLEKVPSEKRTGRFRCVLALVPIARLSSKIAPQFFEGACEGRIQSVASGAGGFGYDPLFVPDGFKLSFAELEADVKNQLSHRARALAGLRRHFRGDT